MVPERVLSDVPLNGCFDASMLRCFDKLGNHKLGNHKLGNRSRNAVTELVEVTVLI